MKFAQLSVILCCLSASARMISRAPTGPRALTRSVVVPQRRALTNAAQPPRPNVGDFIKLRLMLLAASIYTAYEGYECFRIFSDHYEAVDVQHSSEPAQLKQFDEELTELIDIFHRCHDISKDECLKTISESGVSDEIKKLLANLVENRTD